MAFTKEDTERLVEIAQEMSDLLHEFKTCCRQNMTPREYEEFKYRTLGNLEPGLIEESEWVTGYSAIDSLEKVAENLNGDCEDEDDEEND